MAAGFSTAKNFLLLGSARMILNKHYEVRKDRGSVLGFNRDHGRGKEELAAVDRRH